MEASEEFQTARDIPWGRKHPSPQQDDGHLPALPADVLRNVLALVAREWRGRRVQTAKEEVREWTQYCLVCKEWSAAFQSLPLCVVFDKAPSRRQVEWLRTTNAPIRRITFLPSCMPCHSTGMSSHPPKELIMSLGDGRESARGCQRLEHCPQEVSALVNSECDYIHLAPLHHDHATGGVPPRSVGAAA